MKHFKYLLHVEIYGGSRFAFLYLFIAKLFRVPTLNIERGAIAEFLNKERSMNKVAKLSNYLLYKFSDFTWYKEYYMHDPLVDLQAKNLVFIPNSVTNFPNTIAPYIERDIDFIWINRVIKERYLDWVIQLASRKEFMDKQFVVIGFLNDDYSKTMKENIQFLKLPNVKLIDYAADTQKYLNRSKYFLMPAQHVFGNNSLLESMTFGVVPCVSNTEGIENLIENNVNGILFPNNQDLFSKTLIETLEKSEKEWTNLSQAASNKIMKFYGPEIFKERLKKLYYDIHH